MTDDISGVFLLPFKGFTSIFFIFIIIFIGVIIFMFYRMVRVCSTKRRSQVEDLNNCLYNKKHIKQERDRTLSELNDAIGPKQRIFDH